jgi:hypothetical protein
MEWCRGGARDVGGCSCAVKFEYMEGSKTFGYDACCGAEDCGQTHASVSP